MSADLRGVGTAKSSACNACSIREQSPVFQPAVASAFPPGAALNVDDAEILVAVRPCCGPSYASQSIGHGYPHVGSVKLTRAQQTAYTGCAFLARSDVTRRGCQSIEFPARNTHLAGNAESRGITDPLSPYLPSHIPNRFSDLRDFRRKLSGGERSPLASYLSRRLGQALGRRLKRRRGRTSGKPPDHPVRIRRQGAGGYCVVPGGSPSLGGPARGGRELRQKPANRGEAVTPLPAPRSPKTSVRSVGQSRNGTHKHTPGPGPALRPLSHPARPITGRARTPLCGAHPMKDRSPRPRLFVRRRPSSVSYPSTPDELDELSRRTREKLAYLRRSAPAPRDDGPSA